jgi:hypothetical protein
VSPEPAVRGTEGLLPGGEGRPSVRPVARSGDLATTLASIPGSDFVSVPRPQPKRDLKIEIRDSGFEILDPEIVPLGISNRESRILLMRARRRNPKEKDSMNPFKFKRWFQKGDRHLEDSEPVPVLKQL